MHISMIAGGRTAESAGTIGSGRQLAATAARLGHVTSVIELLPNADGAGRLNAILEASEGDVVIPLIPGLEGALELVGKPYVGSTPAAAGIAAHKGLFNDLVVAAGLRKVPYTYGFYTDVARRVGEAALEPPFFVKPARLGASYGIHEVSQPSLLADAVADASRFDGVVVVEQRVPEPFIECEVSMILKAGESESAVGRVRLPDGSRWHDTTSKYSLGTGIEPLKDRGLEAELEQVALHVAQLCGATCALRVDLFVGPNDTIWVGELNALPGHGVASTFPRIFELFDYSRSHQLECMIESAFDLCALQASSAYNL